MSDNYEMERMLRIRAEEDHRAAVEGLETYEARIRDIADHVLGIQPPDVATIVLLDAIERECGRHRIARLRAEADLATLRDVEAKARALQDVFALTHEMAKALGMTDEQWRRLAALRAALAARRSEKGEGS